MAVHDAACLRARVDGRGRAARDQPHDRPRFYRSPLHVRIMVHFVWGPTAV